MQSLENEGNYLNFVTDKDVWIFQKKYSYTSKSPANHDRSNFITVAHQSTTDENKVSLHFAARKQEARRIDSENLNFARRILAQKPLIETKDSMDRSYEKQKQIVKNLSKNSKLSIGHIVSQAELNYSYVRPTMKTQERLPALKVGGARINDSSQMSRKRSPSSQFDLS